MKQLTSLRPMNDIKKKKNQQILGIIAGHMVGIWLISWINYSTVMCTNSGSFLWGTFDKEPDKKRDSRHTKLWCALHNPKPCCRYLYMTERMQILSDSYLRNENMRSYRWYAIHTPSSSTTHNTCTHMQMVYQLNMNNDKLQGQAGNSVRSMVCSNYVLQVISTDFAISSK